MKKFITVLFLATLAACGSMETFDTATQTRRAANNNVTPKEALQDLKLGCFSVKGVDDPEHGKIFYTSRHNLFKYVKIDKSKGDRYFCTASEAEKDGFKQAPEHFSGSVYYLMECLHTEGESGTCHDYVAGIYKSLEIYEKVCGAHPGRAELAEAVETYARKEKDAMDSGKYEGTTAALINKYRCGR